MRAWADTLAFCGVAFGASAEEPYQLLQRGDAAPHLTFRTLDGHRGPSWTALRGTVVVLDFWATWCGPCIEAIPRLNNLVQQFKGKPVRFISVTYEKDAVVRPFLEKHPLDTLVGEDIDCGMFRSYRAWGIPTVVLVGGDGRVNSVIHPNKLSAPVLELVLDGQAPAVEPAPKWHDPKGAEEYFCGGASQTSGPRH
jgi:thiol-disulfide isomerase/thioredoxin